MLDEPPELPQLVKRARHNAAADAATNFILDILSFSAFAVEAVGAWLIDRAFQAAIQAKWTRALGSHCGASIFLLPPRGVLLCRGLSATNYSR